MTDKKQEEISTTKPHAYLINPTYIAGHYTGIVLGHPNIDDGEFITTTTVQNQHKNLVETRNTVYKLFIYKNNNLYPYK